MNGFTPHQQEAIRARGNVLVQAGAGAGKTRTLVQRCLAWLLEDPSHTLDRILMVTFTEAAAAEMRHRIRTELGRALEADPGNRAIAEQIALLELAAISTLHSFCLTLVREHFYELEIDPLFTIAAEEEARVLAARVLDAILDRHYEADAGDPVQRLILEQARGWDVPIRQRVLRLHAYTQTLPDPEGWFDRHLAALARPDPDLWVQWLREDLAHWPGRWLPELERFAGTKPIDAVLAVLRSMPAAPRFAAAHAALKAILDATGPGQWPRGTARKVRDKLDDFFAEARFLASLTAPAESPEGNPPAPGAEADRCPEPLREDWEWSRHPTRALVELTREFGRAYAAAKKESGLVDFHDLEQFSLRLLWDRASGRPTPLAEQWRRKYKLIFVDEYQDINAAQDAILAALGRDGKEANRFLVGDVKQSIYRFRLANPHIFQGYAERWRAGDGDGAGRVIPLSDNFRSHEAILDFINPLFAALMRREIGGVSFDAAAWLQFGNPADRQALTRAGAPGTAPVTGRQPRVELHLRLTERVANESNEESEPSGEAREADDAALAELKTAEIEARMVGLRLRELCRTETPIWDETLQAFRPAEWRDMVILLRSPRHKVESFAKEFERLGIPLQATRGGLFECIEILDLLSLLKLLDNPLQDIETIAVLRSPFVGLSVPELARLRLAANGRFWTALARFHDVAGRKYRSDTGKTAGTAGVQSGPDESGTAADPADPDRDLFRKVDRFLKSFGHWRRLVRQGSLARCLETVLDETHYLGWLATQPRSAQRLGNVAKLLTWVRQFDQFQRQGLFRFLEFIEAQRDADIDHEPAPSESRNAVRLMSVHQSKGLEFPIVVVADLGKPFNLSDLREDVILDEVYGICPRIKPPRSGTRYPSLPHWLAARHQRVEALGEELRVLYVALTRACQWLILSGTVSRKRAAEWAGLPLTTRHLLDSRHVLDWLGPWLSEATGDPKWLDREAGESELVRWTLYDANDTRLLRAEAGPEPVGAADELPDPTPEQRKALLERLSWAYPWLAATTEAAKASVSTLRRRILEEGDSEARPLHYGGGSRRSGEPRETEALAATAVGTAHHVFLQHLSLDRVENLEMLQAEAERMRDAGLLSGPEVSALDLAAIAQFWQAEPGRALLAERTRLHRELPFTVKVPTSELARWVRGTGVPGDGGSTPATPPEATAALSALSDDFVVMQGIVDLAVLLPDEIWLLDFKTDSIPAKDCERQAVNYFPQLQLYARALQTIYSRPVTRAWLHFLAPRRTITCPLALAPVPAAALNPER